MKFDHEVKVAIQYAKQKGLEIEVYATSGSSFHVSAYEGNVEDFSLSDSAGLGIRTVSDNRNGYSYTEDLSDDAIRRAVDEAAENVKLVNPDKGIKLDNYPAPPTINLVGEGIAKVGDAEKIELAKKIEASALGFDPRIKIVPHAGYGEATGFTRIANTKGLDRGYDSNLAWIGCELVSVEGEDTESKYRVKASRSFQDLDADKLSREAARQAILKLGAHEIPSGKYPVVFTPESFCDLLGTFCGMFSARQAQEGKSPLKGRLNEVIANSMVQLIDDPLMKDGFASRPFDDEGVPSKRLVVIKDGKFVSFLHNTQSAAIDGVTPTGNAARSSFRGTVGISPSNFYIEPGDLAPESLCHECVVITDVAGLHSGANPVSGDFSLSAQGFYKGDPIHKFTVSGNIIEVLKNIDGIGCDLEFFTNGMGSPSVRIKELAIAGSK